MLDSAGLMLLHMPPIVASRFRNFYHVHGRVGCGVWGVGVWVCGGGWKWALILSQIMMNSASQNMAHSHVPAHVPAPPRVVCARACHMLPSPPSSPSSPRETATPCLAPDGLLQLSLTGSTRAYTPPDHSWGEQFPGKQAATHQLSLFESGVKKLECARLKPERVTIFEKCAR